MKFLKIYINESHPFYKISITPKEGYTVYFTDEKGNEIAKKEEGKIIRFEELPTPLLKQIK